jgi:hypothetical protein
MKGVVSKNHHIKNNKRIKMNIMNKKRNTIKRLRRFSHLINLKLQ